MPRRAGGHWRRDFRGSVPPRHEDRGRKKGFDKLAQRWISVSLTPFDQLDECGRFSGSRSVNDVEIATRWRERPSSFGLQHETGEATRHRAAISRSPEGRGQAGSTSDDDRRRTSRNREAGGGGAPPPLRGNQTQPRGRGRRDLDKLDQGSPRHQLAERFGEIPASAGMTGERIRPDGSRGGPEIPAFAGDGGERIRPDDSRGGPEIPAPAGMTEAGSRPAGPPQPWRRRRTVTSARSAAQSASTSSSNRARGEWLDAAVAQSSPG